MLSFMCILVLVSRLSSGLKLPSREFVVLHKWTRDMDMTFPTAEVFKYAIKSGYYEASRALPVDVEIEYGDEGRHRTFLSIPRLSSGVPYSLAVVSERDHRTLLNPKVEPYPSYAWHESHGINCSQITSAIKSFIDECWRLWIIDSGQINSIQLCPPQILAFDLVTDHLVHRFQLPEKLYTPGISVFTALIVDVHGPVLKIGCHNTMVYIADPWGYGLIVYDTMTGKSWRIEHEYMRPDKDLQRLNLANDGIFTISLSPKIDNIHKERQLYFHALNSYQEITIPLHVVNNASMWTGVGYGMREISVLGSRETQCESETMDSAGNLYCSLISSSALIRWRERTPYNSNTLQVVAYSPEQFKFITGLKINKNSAGEDEVWALSNNPNLFVGASVNEDEVKFQIVGCRTTNLLRNTECSVGAVGG